MNLQPYLDFTAELAHLSADVILPYYGQREFGLELKGDDSPVTIADREAERVMRAAIEKRFPDHGILGEEYGAQNLDAEWLWILDPIDGTKSFIANVPLFGTLIGLLHQGQPVVGCIHQPVLKQLLIGDNQTTTLNGQPVEVRQTSELSRSLLLTTDPLRPAACHDGAAFGELACAAGTVRTWGDCYGYYLVATGWADIMIDTRMSPWDIFPLVPCVRGAGAGVSGWDGSPIPAFDRSQLETKKLSCVATAPALHSEVIGLLNR